ncbi:SusD/RagB family nutrient-binding outer membrane lipoprotein [Ferruginibacter sp. SUN106]|uniref:SusD/RagB family nutrient-binding outer membrane lipoprotein n=1 Tax=Ferruginibacter sp. SUN106 TaxID=2978348 RepID=UPI003D370108
MKKLSYIILIAVTIAVINTGCKKKFDEYATNPNNPQSVPAYLLLRQVENDLPVLPGGDADKFCQFTLSSYTYYGTNEYWTGAAGLNYGTLRNVVAMENEAAKASGANNPYSAIAKFFKAYFFTQMSLKVGDLPMSEALKGLDNQTPKYDTQKDIFKQSLQLLEDANTQMAALISAANNSILGDFFYKENTANPKDGLQTLRQWQKVVNTYKLRLLIHLSKKETDADLNIKQKFSETISNPAKYPLMNDMNDNLEYVYNVAYNKYPNNKDNYGNDALRLCVAATWLNNLSALNDLRAMKVADPARGLGFSDTSFKSFVGASNGEDVGTMGGKVVAGLYSPIGRKRYYDGYTAENTFIISYPEMCFNIAEGINRGWATGNAEDWYQKGIKAMFGFYGIADGSNTVSFLKTAAPGDYINYNINFSYTDYFSQPAVKYAGNNTAGLNQILLQKYLAYGRNSGFEAYYQWRRTGVPAFLTGPGIGNSGVIPLRWQYPSSELSTNKDNYTKAVQSQYSGNDNINSKMWIIQ